MAARAPRALPGSPGLVAVSDDQVKVPGDARSVCACTPEQRAAGLCDVRCPLHALPPDHRPFPWRPL